MTTPPAAGGGPAPAAALGGAAASTGTGPAAAAGGAPPDGAAPPADRGADAPGQGGDGAAAHPDPHRVGSGGEASEATGGFGQGSQRHGHVQNAFANVDGDAVGRDKYVFLLGGKQERLRRISPLIVERVRFAFEEPPSLAAAREALRKQQIVILRGTAGYGKTAMAVRLLLRGEDRPIYHLDSGVDLRSLAEQLEHSGANGGAGGIEPGAGFLLDRPADIGNLRGEVYEMVQGALAEAGASMVLTVSGTAVADSELLTGVVDLAEPPDQRGIVTRYLDWRLGERTARRLLEREDMAELLDEQLAGAASCKLAADLAAVICEEHEAGTLEADRIRARRARLEAEDFEIWAEGLREPAVRSFAFALAVLNGLPQENVARAARALHRRLDAEHAYAVTANAEAGVPRLKDPFAVPRRKMLTRLRARAVPKDTFNAWGRVPAEGLEYKDPDYAKLVIRHAWSQYEIQDAMLGWLAELTTDVSEQVRVYAAVALGLLASESFPYLTDHVFRPWAHSENANRREAVAYALSVAATDPLLRSQVTALVAGWYADRTHPMGQATAARVHGMSRGADQRRSIDALGRLAAVDHVTVAVAIGHSFTDLLADDYALAPLVLGRLWQALQDARTRPTALLAFLIVASQLVVDTDEWEIRGSSASWPALLHLAQTRDEVRLPFVTLWRDALNQPFFSTEAEQVLGSWAAPAESDERLREALMAMAGAITYGDPRSGRILRRCAADWVDEENLAPLPLTAAALNAVLDREKV
ncbi:hypothetical protein [Streptomyces sp. 8N706]|uniref:hypothetical protein n=1 Tax=Streptomyces sp. 8N706 TaxID=3457416 RepID=UPI003FD32FA3